MNQSKEVPGPVVAIPTRELPGAEHLRPRRTGQLKAVTVVNGEDLVRGSVQLANAIYSAHQHNALKLKGSPHKKL